MDDAEIISDWCREQLGLYDAVVCLDGSTTDHTARLASAYGEQLVYLHERDYAIAHKTDHALRDLVHGGVPDTGFQRVPEGVPPSRPMGATP